MRICFCDDEPAMRQLLEQMVRRWAQQTGTACELSCCASAEQMLFENQENFAFDLILLDIQMERMDGIQLAKTIRQRDQRVLIAFLTAVREHVFEGYEVQAVRYLLKPLQEEKLFELLQLAADRAREQRPYLILGPEGERRKVYLDALLSVEAQGHYLLLDTDCRMNTPSTVGSNWEWRMEEGAADEILSEDIREMVELYHRRG